MFSDSESGNDAEGFPFPVKGLVRPDNCVDAHLPFHDNLPNRFTLPW
jgi:hypothetical protein